MNGSVLFSGGILHDITVVRLQFHHVPSARDTVEIDLLSCSKFRPDAAHAVATRAHGNLKTVHLSVIVVDVERHGFSYLPHRCSGRSQAGHLVTMLLKASVDPDGVH
jgi:hypothetical protein